MGMQMGVDLSALPSGRVTVVESSRRWQGEPSYGYLRVFWWLWLTDGPSVVSVPPGTRDRVRSLVEHIQATGETPDATQIEALKVPINEALATTGYPPVNRIFKGVSFAVNGTLLRCDGEGDILPLTDERYPPVEGLMLPRHCFPDGTCYGKVIDGEVVAVGYAHRTGMLEDRVADLGVETAEGYRRRRYAKAVVSAVVRRITDQGGEGYYGCSPDNLASIATARGVGFVPYGASLMFSDPLKAGED